MIAKIGAHVNATAYDGSLGTAENGYNANREQQYDFLRRMGAETCRVQMFWGGERRFSNDAIASLVSAVGGNEVILLSSEDVRLIYNPDGSINLTDGNSVHVQWNVVKYFAQTYPTTQWVFEIGNEPNLPLGAEAPDVARDRLMEAYKYCAGSKPANVRLAVNQPAVTGNDSDGAFFNAFNERGPHGSPIHDVDIVTCHTYGYSNLCVGNGGNEPFEPWKIVRWVRSWNATVPIKLTEAGIDPQLAPNAGSTEDEVSFWRPYKYVEAAFNVERDGGPGPCDSICFYCNGLDSGGGGRLMLNHYRGDEVDIIGRRERTFDCP